MQNFAAIPQSLRALRRWINWHYVSVPGSEKPTKVPLDPLTGHQTDATKIENGRDFTTAVANVETGRCAGIGFILGDGIAGIDLDDPKGDESRITLYNKILERFPTYQEWSPSGLGAHIIFAHDDGAQGGRRRNGVEFYYSHRFLTFTGNSMNGAHVADCTTNASILFNEMGGARTSNDVDEPQKEEDAVIIERAARASNGADFRALWSGQWLSHPSQSEADQHLMNIIAYYTSNREQCKRIFCQSALAQTLNRKPKPGYYLNLTVDRAFDQKMSEADLARVRIDLSAALQAPQVDPGSPPIAARAGRLEPPPWPGGLLGEIAAFIKAQSHHPVDDIAIVGAIGLLAGICGRSYNINGAGLNQYILLVAPSGRGKEAINSGISKLIHAVKGGASEGMTLDMVPAADTFIGPEHISSQPALMKHLAENKSFVSVIGEFGLHLRKISSERASGVDVELRKALLSLYGKSGFGNTQRATIYSDKQKNTATIAAPALSIVGETNPLKFYELLTEDMIEEGLLPRFLVWEYNGERTPLNKAAGSATPSPALVAKLRSLVVTSLERNQKETPIDVVVEEAADTLFDEFEEFTRQRINELGASPLVQLWNRAFLKMMRLAALGAVGVNPSLPRITVEIALWAKTIVVRDVQSMMRKFEMGEVGDTREQKRVSYILRLMREFLRDPKISDKYKVKPAYHHAHIVPMKYLSTRTGGHNSFKVPPRTAHTVLLETIKMMIDVGYIHEMPAALLSQTVGSSQRAFTLDPSAIGDD